MNIKIKSLRGYFEIYLDGRFVCSCDTRAEADEEIKIITDSGRAA